MRAWSWHQALGLWLGLLYVLFATLVVVGIATDGPRLAEECAVAVAGCR